MKILIVNAHDLDGGAARAAYRLHKALLNKNIDSTMLVQNKKSDDYTVLGPLTKFEKLSALLRPTIDNLPFYLFKNKSLTLFSCGWLPSSAIVKKINAINPDVVHLHWINCGMLRVEDLIKIKAPIVWSLHDMWPFNGGWHYDETLVSSYQKKLDLRILKRKKKVYANMKDLTVIGVSRWLQECAKNSGVFKNKKVVNLPNPIDCTIYSPVDKEFSRTLWNLPKDKKLVLFGAMGATSDPRKGFNELVRALSLINDEKIEFVVFGASKPKKPLDIQCKIHYMGTLNDDVSLVSLYSTVDVMLVPSSQEAFGQTASEAMSCGTPVVAFSHTGLLDIVDHKKNGYLATPFDTVDLAKGIEWVLLNIDSAKLSINARQKILTKFDSSFVADEYIKLYADILN